jgi:hypothetical protein
MRFLSTRSHGVTDYLKAEILIAAPRLLGFAEEGAETRVPEPACSGWVTGRGAALQEPFRAHCRPEAGRRHSRKEGFKEQGRRDDKQTGRVRARDFP